MYELLGVSFIYAKLVKIIALSEFKPTFASFNFVIFSKLLRMQCLFCFSKLPVQENSFL